MSAYSNSSSSSSSGEGADDDMSSSAQMDMFHMFPDESRQFKVALFVVLASHCPAAQRVSSVPNSDGSGVNQWSANQVIHIPYRSWSYKLLKCAQLSLDIDVHHLEAYCQIIPSEIPVGANSSSSSVLSGDLDAEYRPIPQPTVSNSSVRPFLDIVKARITNSFELLMEVVLFLMSFSLLPSDSKSEVLINNLGRTFKFDRDNIIKLKSILFDVFNDKLPQLNFKVIDCNSLLDVTIASIHAKGGGVDERAVVEGTNKTSNKAKYIRYAKIGGATIGAAALIALTGGLAAPAVAAAVGVTMAATTATALAVTGVTFSSTYVGYKAVTLSMEKGSVSIGPLLCDYSGVRGEGLSTSSASSIGESNSLTKSTVIFITGFLGSEMDLHRVYGGIPKKQTLKERLIRYYKIYAPEKIASAEEEALMWANSSQDLLDRMADEFDGVNPLLDANLVPRYDRNVASQGSLDSELSTMLKLRLMALLRLDDDESVGAAGDISDDLNVLLANIRFNPVSISDPSSSSHSGGGSGGNGNSSSSGNYEKKRKEKDRRGDEEEEEFDDSNSIFTDQYWHLNEWTNSDSYYSYLFAWDVDMQVKFGLKIQGLIAELGTAAVKNVLASTVFAAIATALVLPALIMTMFSSLDNIWNKMIYNAEEAGKELARVLMNRADKRPVTLIGYSMGSRVIFSCLRELFIIRFGHILRKSKGSFTSSSGKSGGAEKEDGGGFFSSVFSKDKDKDKDKGKEKESKSFFSSVFSKDDDKDRDKDKDKYKDLEFKTTSSSSESGGRSGGGTYLDGHVHNADSSSDTGASTSYDYVDEGEDGGGIINEDDSTPEEDDDDYICFEEMLELWDDLIVNSGDKSSSNNMNSSGSSSSGNGNSNTSIFGLEDIIKDVVLLGTPVSYNDKFWKYARLMVSGRFINGYSSNDMVLKIVYRYQRFKSGVAGVYKIPNKHIENVNLSHIIDKHTDYSVKMREVLEYLNISPDSSRGELGPMFPRPSSEQQAPLNASILSADRYKIGELTVGDLPDGGAAINTLEL